ncbi:hypothetical protein C791_7725 [Amycolatopsis azurea DSM 43854]|uniref:Uncharacterized protein n=1 Tax=Amycolatopsis azurea DSM 43854 TaxID=1238180 RepID=M2PU51_9PSEU|nr:hypothetical protein C791_7725 [Amycolatopsis azurea DSM 43854]
MPVEEARRRHEANGVHGPVQVAAHPSKILGLPTVLNPPTRVTALSLVLDRSTRTSIFNSKVKQPID